MRTLTSHKVNECNESLDIFVADEPGQGGACHEYRVEHPNRQIASISFQNGPIKEVGVNGVTQEALLAIVEDRLICFQVGPYACRENAVALTKIQEAMMWLQKRTRDRIARGVEGTHEK